MSKCSLDFVKKTKQASILGFSKGLKNKNRLLSLGILPGSPITVLRNNRTLPLLVEIDGMRVALGRAEAKNIFVSLSA